MPQLTASAALLLSASLVGTAVAEQANTDQTAPAKSFQELASGDRFLAEVLATLQRRPSVSARLRHQARIYDDTVMGTGKYWQLGVGLQRRTRWEMQMQVADTTSSFLQVFDGEHLWTDRTLPSGRKVLRLDTGRLQTLRRTQQLTERPEQPLWGPLLDSTAGQGGLTETLADLLRRFTFAPRRKAQLNGLPVYALLGQWRQEELEKVWPGLTGKDQDIAWPKHLPHHVLLLVGENNLFPYVLEHRRASDAMLVQSAAGIRPVAKDPLMRLEVFEVQLAAALDDSLFEYSPGDMQWSDETQLVFERMEALNGDSSVQSTESSRAFKQDNSTTRSQSTASADGDRR